MRGHVRATGDASDLVKLKDAWAVYLVWCARQDIDRPRYSAFQEGMVAALGAMTAKSGATRSFWRGHKLVARRP